MASEQAQAPTKATEHPLHPWHAGFDAVEEAQATVRAVQQQQMALSAEGFTVMLEWRRPGNPFTVTDFRRHHITAVGPLVVLYRETDGAFVSCFYRELDLVMHQSIPSAYYQTPGSEQFLRSLERDPKKREYRGRFVVYDLVTLEVISDHDDAKAAHGNAEKWADRQRGHFPGVVLVPS